MLTSRLFGFPVLLAAATGCGMSAASPRTSVTPERGPVARIHATYSGGLTQRTLRADFTVDRGAHVLVGHLRGDGVIEVLYPESATQSDVVRRGKSYAVRGVSANYDGVPQLFDYASRAYRNPGARTDSYDGRGNGFVFIIASIRPLYVEELQEGGEWTNDYEVPGYSWTSDPRLGIKRFADRVAGGFNYTLKYANSFSTNALVSYASRQWDCSLLSSMFGYGSMFFEPGFGNWGSSFSSFSWYYYRPTSFYTLAHNNWYGLIGAFDPGCGGMYRGYTATYYNRGMWSEFPGYINPSPTITPNPPAPAAPRTETRLDVPRGALGFRNGTLTESGPAFRLRARLDRGNVESSRAETARTSQPEWTRMRLAREEAQRRATRAGYDSPRYDSPRYDSPRSESPRYASPRNDSPRYESPRYESPRAPVHEAPRVSYTPPPSPPPAAAAPASPPPKIEASSGKPRQP